MYKVLVGNLLDKFKQGEVVSKKDIGKNTDKYEKQGYILKIATQSDKKGTANGSKSN